MTVCRNYVNGEWVTMIDLKDVRENPDRYREAARLKRIDVNIDQLLELESRRRSLDAKRQQLTAEKNAIGKQIVYRAGRDQGADPQAQVRKQQLDQVHGHRGERENGIEQSRHDRGEDDDRDAAHPVNRTSGTSRDGLCLPASGRDSPS